MFRFELFCFSVKCELFYVYVTKAVGCHNGTSLHEKYEVQL